MIVFVQSEITFLNEILSDVVFMFNLVNYENGTAYSSQFNRVLRFLDLPKYGNCRIWGLAVILKLQYALIFY